MKRIFKCQVCGAFTMKEIHCGKKTFSPKPVKYSPEDKYGKYRRIAKKEQGLN
jgi:H/ACA ribonucleoprotein complex subunit 3